MAGLVATLSSTVLLDAGSGLRRSGEPESDGPGGTEPSVKLRSRVIHGQVRPAGFPVHSAAGGPGHWETNQGRGAGMLGRLEPVSPRDIWPNESSNFTPWLAAESNLALLGATLGMELELEAQEKDVGPYRADIVCRDTADASWVLVENQLEATDHSHLGQILTYAAGLNAVTVVWIAVRFTDEHRAALDWLNEISGDNVQFFGLEVEVWRIGDSQPAPKFNVVAKPNDWTKGGGRSQAIRAAELTEAKQLQLEFWHGFREFVLDLDRPTRIKPTKALPQHWMNIAIGRTGFRLNAIASLYDADAGYGGHEVRAEFEIYDRDSAKGYYRALELARESIEAETGEPLTWYNPETANACRIYLRRSADLEDADQRDDLYVWLLEKLETLHRVFADRVRSLEPVADEANPDAPAGVGSHLAES